jgi:hypothetical protein
MMLMKYAAIALALIAALGAAAQTRNNDDSCDLAIAPAATLLVPYFEVDVTSPLTRARTVLISITNVSPLPQIARVTLWTDWAYPVLTFNIYLTGYDLQSINLHDVLTRGVIATNAEEPGALSSDLNWKLAQNANCAKTAVQLPEATLEDVRNALTIGSYAECGTQRIGGVHTNAIGYATIDVVATCTSTFPDEPEYFESELLFDNVLIGDVITVDRAVYAQYAMGEPMVHIRAIPEGGAAGSQVATNLPLTFYDRLSGGRDRRQPLPSVFAARYVQGGAMGFLTNFRIWREAITTAGATCTDYIRNRGLELAEYIRFDERENPTTISPEFITIYIPTPNTTPVAISLSTMFTNFPPLRSGDVAGWMYLNLDNAGGFKATPRPRRSQNWVSITMFAESRYAADTAAIALGNGCSPAQRAPTTRGRDANPIGPLP